MKMGQIPKGMKGIIEKVNNTQQKRTKYFSILNIRVSNNQITRSTVVPLLCNCDDDFL